MTITGTANMINKELGYVQINKHFDSMNNNFEKITQMAQSPLEQMSETINGTELTSTPTIDIAKAIDTNVPEVGNAYFLIDLLLQILHKGGVIYE